LGVVREPGDWLTLYTDGITEAPAGRLRGHERGNRGAGAGVVRALRQRRAHGFSVVPPFPARSLHAQDRSSGAGTASPRPRGGQLGPGRGSLVVEREEREAHGRHARPRLLGEPRARPTPVAEPLTRTSVGGWPLT